MKTNAKVYVMVDSEGRIKLGHSVNPAARSKQMPRAVTVVHEKGQCDDLPCRI